MADKKFYTWKQIEQMSLYLADLVEDKFYTHIIGISRGGCIPATIISHKLDIPMIPITLSTRDHAKEWVPDFPVGHGDGIGYIDRYKFLVVDDINDTGATINAIKDVWDSNYVTYAVLFNNEASEAEVDYSARDINKLENDVWIIFPWEDWWQ